MRPERERTSPRWLWLIVAGVALIGIVVGLFFLFRGKKPVELPKPPYPTETHEKVNIDFDALQKQNPDIYAWLQVPGADVNHPVSQRPGADVFYLHSDLNGNYSDGGSLFTQETYNGTDFTDPATVIYGHQMEDGSMFGSLQPWVSSVSLEDGVDFYVYLPGEALTYRVYAAVPWSDRHILYYFDFSKEASFELFFRSVRAAHDLNAQIAPELAPQYGDRIAILETCLAGDETRRFLIIGVLVEDVFT